MATKNDQANHTVADNRKARHDYFVDESYEAGIALTGSEIKSIRAGRVNLRGGYARVQNGEIWLYDVHISPYDQSGKYFNHEPTRPRKLLLHRREIHKFADRAKEQGLTLIPLKMYFNKGRVKVLMGLCRGRKKHDKREAIKKRESQRDIGRALRRG